MATRRITLTIPEKENVSYPVIIGTDLLKNLSSLVTFGDYSQVLILLDEKLEESLLPLLQPLLSEQVKLHAVECGEKFKSFSCLEQLLGTFHQNRIDRKSLILNIGGGMLGDFGGFAASIYMRGIPFIQVPTTLLAQVDASVGGKVAINFSGVKNLIGAFQQPEMVIVDTGLLSTLPRREFFSGFAEIIKHAIIQDEELLTRLERAKPDSLSDEELAEIIEHSCSIKAHVVQQDPHETGLRRILNFGHTIGHAIESLAAETCSPLLHGECVSLGIMAEAALSVERGNLSKDSFKRIGEVLRHFQLPIYLEQKFSTDALIERMQSDKKNASGTILMALPALIGSCQPKIAVDPDEIARALQVLYR